MKKYIFALTIMICSALLFSCSSVGTVDDTEVVDSVKTTGNHVTENVIIDKTNSDTESFAEPTDINAVGGGNFDELKLKFRDELSGVGAKPGDENFYHARKRDVSDAISKYEKLYPSQNSWRIPEKPPLMYFLIREMPLSREEVELYSREHDNLFSEELIDALFNDNLGEAMHLFLSPYNFYCDGGAYTFYHFYELVTAPDSGYKITDFENYEEVLANVYEYMYSNYSGEHSFITYYPTEMVVFVERYIPEKDRHWIRYETDSRGVHYSAPEPVAE